MRRLEGKVQAGVNAEIGASATFEYRAAYRRALQTAPTGQRPRSAPTHRRRVSFFLREKTIWGVRLAAYAYICSD